MSDSNPYATPAAIEHAPPEDHFWYTEGEAVYVRHRAILPAVDLESGAYGEALKPALREFTTGAWKLLAVMGVAAIAVALLPHTSDIWPIITGTLLFVGFASGLLPKIGMKGMFSKIQFQISQDPVVERKQARGRRLSIGVLMSSTAVTTLLAGFLSTVNLGWMKLAILIGCLGIVLSGVLYHRVRPKISLSTAPHYWVKIRGTCPAALGILKEIERQRDSAKIQ